MGQIFVSCFSKSFVAAILSSIGFIVWSPAWAQPAATKFGTFCGSPVVEFENDGRKIKLREDFCFKDDKNRVWQVPKDYVVDGASIPQAFWSFIGGPLDGAYRNASIIHDFFCDRRTHDWREVHLVFYKGMRAAGVGSRKAWVMYQAVNTFGPRWEKKIEIPKECKPGPDFSAEDCVINSEPVIVTYKNPLNKDSLDAFLSELRKTGYSQEATELESAVKLQ